MPDRLVVAGARGGTAIGASLVDAAAALGVPVEFADTNDAFRAPRAVRMAAWHLFGKRPPRLGQFGDGAVATCERARPRWLVSTGIAPLDAAALRDIGGLGVQRVNFLTDDPWNPAHRAAWFLRALPHYDVVYTPRRANIDDLGRAGCRNVRYLPFAYDPAIFSRPTAHELAGSGFAPADVVFAGGADDDRVAYMQALADAGFSLALYGGYWERFAQLRACYRGVAEPATLRLALASAKVGLCLVRRANRDGNAMRTFEVPAAGTCMLAEDTPEHREILGPEGERVLYFGSIGEMVDQCRRLCADDALRERLAHAGHEAMRTGGHTWQDRLATMLADAEWDGGRG